MPERESLFVLVSMAIFLLDTCLVSVCLSNYLNLNTLVRLPQVF